MPVEEETKEVETTRTVTTTKYHCAEDHCPEFVADWDPKNDDAVANPNADPGHIMNYVSLNPYAVVNYSSKLGQPSQRVAQQKAQIEDQVGVYVCNHHLHRAMDLIMEKMEKENG